MKSLPDQSDNFLSNQSASSLENYESLNKELFIRNLEVEVNTQEILKINKELQNQKQIIAEKNHDIDLKNIEIHNKHQQLLHKDYEILSIKKSNSWKVTKPLRIISSILKKIFIFLKEKSSRQINLEGTTTNVLQESNNNIDRNDFKEWARRYDSMTTEKRNEIKSMIQKLDFMPKISVIMPTYNPNIEWLIQAIESVQNQLYTNWELCIADDASSNKDIRSTLEEIAKNDQRIKLVFRKENGHISAASNSATELATSDWLALLDHDDVLPEDALFWVAQAIVKNPTAGLIYSDECTISNSGQREGHYFKCDWNYDLFLSHNMICHLGVYRRDLVTQVSGFRLGLEGSQDHDLALRVIELLEPSQIIHIPRILYHWRIHKGSTASDISAKPYALDAGVKAIQDHLDRRNVKAKVSYTYFHQYRVQYELPDNIPLVTIIIPTKNGLELIQKCILSILKKTTYSNYEIIIIDNNSDDLQVLEYLKKISVLKNIKILRDERPFNYSALNNNAVKQANGEYIVLLNNDTEVITPDWLTEMVSIAIQPGVGAVGARLWYPDDTLQHGGVILSIGNVAGHSHRFTPKGAPGYINRARLTQTLSAVTGACLLVSKKIYEEVGGLDEVNLTVAYNDVDFCMSVTAKGYRNVWTPYAELYHYESISRGAEDTPAKLKRATLEINYMKSKWGAKLHYDPFYSPNLAINSEDFALAWPPRITLND